MVDLSPMKAVRVDSDARPRNDWLRLLVAPLADEGMGAATGYRWFIPNKGGFASRLRSVWNASIASALGERSETSKSGWGVGGDFDQRCTRLTPTPSPSPQGGGERWVQWF